VPCLLQLGFVVIAVVKLNYITKVQKLNRIVIPKKIAKKMGIKPGSFVKVSIKVIL
jgi:AbrB family looped-hinge helix DNA binding protein